MPGRGRGTLPRKYWLYSGVSSSTCSTPARLPGVPGSLSGPWARETLYLALGCDSAPCLRAGKSGSKAGKTLCLRTGIRPTCTRKSFLVRVCPYVVLQMSKTAAWHYYLSAAPGRNSAGQGPSAGSCELFPPSLSQSDYQWLSPTDSGCSPLGQDQSRGSHEAPTMFRG